MNALISAKLIRRGWLKRRIEFSLSDGVHVFEYSGRGLADKISVDGNVIRKWSWWWFVPRFEFELGGQHGVVDVRVWPWLLLRCLVLRVGDRVVYAERTTRVQFTVRGMMLAVAVASLACFALSLLLRQPIGAITRFHAGRVVPITFVVVDANTRAPVPRAKLALSGQRTRHDLETGPDGRASLTFQPGCDEPYYLLQGLVYTVHYSNWQLELEAGGYDRVANKLSDFRADTSYADTAVPPPIVIQITKRADTL